ncbi:hypothetical protein [Nonomuraea sp. KM90]|uniref:hypothetical protein n=1 Tax=Nonomuraea sp. KM90 TaxID=3457428 RepID=UPI003FCDC451
MRIRLSTTPSQAMLTQAGQPDRDRARELLARLRMPHPQLTLLWDDSADGPGRWWSRPAAS